MRQYLIILLLLLPGWAVGQMVEPVKWSGEEVPAASSEAVDSVRLTATIQDGWHMTLISVGDEEIGEEIYETPYTLTFAANEVKAIRYNSCNDQMCTAPEVFEYSVISSQQSVISNQRSAVSGQRGLWMIFVLGLLGGLLAIFTPCVWPIIPMTAGYLIYRVRTRKREVTA